MPFLDITVIPVPTANKAAYLEHSRQTTPFFKEAGATAGEVTIEALPRHLRITLGHGRRRRVVEVAKDLLRAKIAASWVMASPWAASFGSTTFWISRSSGVETRLV